MTLHMPQFNGVIDRIFAVIKEVALDMILNEKLNDTSKKMMWAEAFHTYKRVRNGRDATGSTNSLSTIFYENNPKISGLLSEFGNIASVTKRDKLRRKLHTRRTRP